MSPRAFDPMQRARDFPRMPSPRRQMFTMTAERQAQAAMRLAAAAVDYAIQPTANTPIEIVHALPEATSSDLTRQILVQLPGETLSSIYVGALNPDGAVFWQLMARGVEIDDGGGTSEAYTFFGHVDTAGFGTLRCLEMTTSHIYFGAGSSDIWRYVRSGGSIVLYVAGFPSGSRSAFGIAFLTAPPSIWVTIPVSDLIEMYDGSTITASGAVNDYWGIDVLTSGGGPYLVVTDQNGGNAHQVNRTTLAVITSFASGCSSPRGIATNHSTDDIFIADHGNNRVRKYNSAFVNTLNWGTVGSGDGQFSGPEGVAVDGEGLVYVTDSGNDRVQVFASDGSFVGKFGTSGTGAGQLDNPVDITVLGNDIAVADQNNGRISLWTKVP